MIQPVIRFRHIGFFFKKNWYSIRVGEYSVGGTYHLLDIGAITIGWRNI